MEKMRGECLRIGPSLLAADFTRLGDAVRDVELAGANVLHCDVMDGVFVPNLSFGFPILESLRRTTSLPFDTHLMIVDPDRNDYVDRCVAVGASMVSFHLEAFDLVNATPDQPWNQTSQSDVVRRAERLIRRIQSLGAKAGIALAPRTPIAAIGPLAEWMDFLLIMSVEPGFGNQTFMPQVLDKVRDFRRRYGNERVVSIDGGVNVETIGACVAAGVNYPIAGTAVFGRLPTVKRGREENGCGESAECTDGCRPQSPVDRYRTNLFLLQNAAGPLGNSPCDRTDVMI